MRQRTSRNTIHQGGIYPTRKFATLGPFLIYSQPSTGPIDAVREKREFWEVLYAAVAAQMAAGTPADQVPDVLLASDQFKIDFLDRMEPRSWRASEVKILLRRVATYIQTGR